MEKGRDLRYSGLGSMKPKYRRMLRGMRAQEEKPASTSATEAVWSLYILECSDGSFYTGVSTDVDRRLGEHQKGTASRYTRTRRPVVLVYREECGSRASSLSRECAVKSLSRQAKEELVSGGRPERKKGRSG
jgi:putative endonuclease